MKELGGEVRVHTDCEFLKQFLLLTRSAKADDKRSSACLAHWLSCLPKGCLRSLNLSWTFVFCDNVVPCLYEQVHKGSLLLMPCCRFPAVDPCLCCASRRSLRCCC